MTPAEVYQRQRLVIVKEVLKRIDSQTPKKDGRGEGTQYA